MKMKEKIREKNHAGDGTFAYDMDVVKRQRNDLNKYIGGVG